MPCGSHRGRWGTGAANVVGLPECGDLGDEAALQGFELRFGDGDAVELLEEVGDAAALEHHAAAGDFRGMGGEDGDDADAAEKVEGLGGVNASLAQAAERAAKIAALDCAAGRAAFAELVRQTAALAMVRFCEVDELEVEAKGTGKLVGGGEIEGADTAESLLQMGGGGGLVDCTVLWSFGFATRDGGAAKGFDGFVERAAGLFAENLAEEHAKRTDVSAQRSFLELAGRGLKLGEALAPVSWSPKRRHTLIMPCIAAESFSDSARRISGRTSQRRQSRPYSQPDQWQALDCEHRSG